MLFCAVRLGQFPAPSADAFLPAKRVDLRTVRGWIRIRKKDYQQKLDINVTIFEVRTYDLRRSYR